MKNWIFPSLLLAGTFGVVMPWSSAFASNHMEAPSITGLPKSSLADLYQFQSYPRITYDSNQCEKYNSGTFFLPNPDYYDQRMVDEAMGYIDNLSDSDFMKFMDWMDGIGPPPLAIRGTDLYNAMDVVDWMTDDEIDEIWWLTEERDDDLYFGGPGRLRIAFNGVIARALEVDTGNSGLGPRFGELGSRINFPLKPPTLVVRQGLTEGDLENLKNFFNQSGAVVDPPAAEGGDYSVHLPFKMLYNYDRFQLRAAYNYGVDNKITDGSVPTITTTPKGETFLPEEGDYSVGFDADPFLNYVGNFLNSGAPSPTANWASGNQDADYDTPYLDELTLQFEQTLTDDLAVSISGFYTKTHKLAEDSPGLFINPSWVRFHYENFGGGGMTEVAPSTLTLDPIEPVDNVVDDLQPFSLADPKDPEVHDPGITNLEGSEAPFDWDAVSPRIGFSYDLGGYKTLNIPLGYLDKSSTPQNNQTTTTEGGQPTNTYGSNIKFKIEESVFENNQTNTQPAEEVVVKLGFPVPPMPLQGNPRIDTGASDDPVQGEVDPETGTIELKAGLGVDWFNDLDLQYVYPEGTSGGARSVGESLQDSDPETNFANLDIPTESLWTLPRVSIGVEYYPYRVFGIRGSVRGSNFLQDGADQTDGAASTTNANAESSDQEGDSRLQGRQSDIDWNDVQTALGEFADVAALDRMRNRDGQHEGGSTDNPVTDLEERVAELEATTVRKANARSGRVFNGEVSPGGSRYKISENNSATPSDRVLYNYNYFNDTPAFQGGRQDIIRYDTPSFGPVRIGSGIRGTPSGVDMDINMNPIESRLIFSDSPIGGIGGFNPFSYRSFQLKNNTLTAIFFPENAEAGVNDWIGRQEGITRVDPNVYRDKQGNDPYFSSSGSWGQDYADQWAIQHVGFTNDENSAWAAAGNDLAPVIVAVIDTGIDWNHADISWDVIWNNEDEIPDNGIDDDNNGYVDDVIGWDFFQNTNLPWDEDGHGTFVSGVIAASSDNETGISGINPAAKIMVLKALDSFGHTRASYLVEAIVYAVDNGAQIINLSVGGVELSYAEQLAVEYAEEHGVLVVAAAGNKASEASNFGFVPYESVITVGSTTIDDTKSNFSNWGEGIDVVAPGEDVLSLRARRTDLMLNVRHLEYEMGTAYVGDDNRYYRAAGTSFSAPIVTGIASLIWSKNPDLTHTEVRRMVLQTAKDVEVPGRDQLTGFGLVDATAALNADPDFEIIADILGVEVVQEDGAVFVAVNGTADANDFDGAQIYIGAGESPEGWKAVGEGIRRSVAGGRLDLISATEFQGAPQWIIRLVVTHENGKTREERYTLNLN